MLTGCLQQPQRWRHEESEETPDDLQCLWPYFFPLAILGGHFLDITILFLSSATLKNNEMVADMSSLCYRRERSTKTLVQRPTEPDSPKQ